MPVLLKATLDRSAASRATLPPLAADNRKNTICVDPNGQHYLYAIGRQSTTVSASSYKSALSANGEVLPPLPVPESKTVVQRVKWLYKYFHINYLLPLVFVMLYMFAGAVIFLFLEKDVDDAKKQKDYLTYLHERDLLVKRMEEILTDLAAQRPGQRRLFIEEAVDYFHSQVGFFVSNKSEWSLITALYYSGTLFTTIGYGDVACVTVWGRIMTVIYSMVGIPLMLITLNDLGKFLYKMINNLVKISKHKVVPLESIWNRCDGRTSELDKLERGENTEKEKVVFQISTEGTTDDEKTVDFVDEMLEEKKSSTPNVPVPVALFITIGWIFACAGMFKIWESDWTYAESCYFMFISLSTIGLGDVAVKRRDLMVLCFVFVIIGLSLVSMCISVIQSALEDLYMKILFKMLIEYQNKLFQGDSHTGASMGMMKIWGGQKTAKYLMPLLSKEKRKTAMVKVQNVAEAKGMEIPKIFNEIDEKTGMPNVFALSKNDETLVEEIKHAEGEADVEQKMSYGSFASPLNVIMYDSNAQTDNPYMEEKSEQTSQVNTVDANVGNEADLTKYECTGVQCERVSIREESSQTFNAATKNDDTMTETVAHTQNTSQTERLGAQDEELQTHLGEYFENDAQTEEDFLFAMRHPTTNTGVQTDRKPRTTARSRAKNSFYSLSRRKSASASFSGWTDPLLEEDDESGSSDSAESLDWNPRDGLHAEKQRSVRDLKKFWDVKSVGDESDLKRKTQ